MPSAQTPTYPDHFNEVPTLAIKGSKVGAPRLDPYQRLLSRLFEPLLLLRVIGQTRGKHTSEPRGSDELQIIRRSFLQALAYLCDFTKGGPSCTAIAVEETKNLYIFWVAVNDQKHGELIASFLRGILRLLHRFNHAREKNESTTYIRETLLFACVRFANSRVTRETKNLKKSITKCQEYIEEKGLDPSHKVSELLQTFNVDTSDDIDQCRVAWSAAKSKYMALLSMEAKREDRLRGPDDPRGPFAQTHHSIGRLAYRYHVYRLLLQHSVAVSSLLSEFEVRTIPHIEAVPPPLQDGHTTLEGILNRMLKRGDPERNEIEGNLITMDRATGTFRKFMFNLEKCEPVVHAEVKTLEHFFKRQLKFAENDRFIAISKPACLCCKLYFQHHPARMVIPQSHEKVWHNWSPPLLKTFGRGNADSDLQRDVLNKIIEALRRDVVAQVLRCSQAAPWHADSQSGITALGEISSSSTDYWTSESELGESSSNPSSPKTCATELSLLSSGRKSGSQTDLRDSAEDNDDAGDGGVPI